MSFFGNAVSIKDGPNLDAFSRLRVSTSQSLFEAQQEYGLSSLIWETATSGAGSSVAADTTTKMVSLTCGTGATDYALVQSRQYVRYIPGKSHLVLLTGIFSPGAISNNTVRSGYFDSANGVFLSVTNGVASFTIRSSTSGSVSDSSTVAKTAWNIDKFDGTGPSGLTIDLTKTQILFIQAQWLGVGRVVVGFDINGIMYPAHQFITHANNIVVPYTQSFNLPIRMESRNSAGSSGSSVAKLICCSVQSEGGQTDLGFPFGIGNGATTIAVTTRRAVLSIRPKATFNSLTNRGHIDLSGIEVVASGADAYWELIYNATLGGTPAFASVDASSITEKDVAGTTITGGRVLANGYVAAGSKAGGSIQKSMNTRDPLTISKIDGGTTTQNTYTLACTGIAGTATVVSAMNWLERYT